MYGTHGSPKPLLHMRLATNDTDPITMIPTSTVSPPYGSTICACEALAVLVVGEGEVVPVPVPVLVEVAELEVAAAVAGREESFASVCYHDILISVLVFILVLGPVTITKERTLSQHVPRSERQMGQGEQERGNCLRCTRRTDPSRSYSHRKARSCRRRS